MSNRPGSPAVCVVAAVMVVGPATAASRIDHEAETTWRTLTWDDFRGSLRRGQQAAGIATNIVIELGASTVDEAEPGVWVARPVGQSVYAVMDKLRSGVGPGGKTDEILAHEQLHFDLAEVQARRLHAELLAIEARGASEQAARNRLVAAVNAAYSTHVQALARMQAEYDAESVHGTRRKQQRKWAKGVTAMLAAAAPYPLR